MTQNIPKIQNIILAALVLTFHGCSSVSTRQYPNPNSTRVKGQVALPSTADPQDSPSGLRPAGRLQPKPETRIDLQPDPSITTPSNDPRGQATIYIVKRGDTLSKIAYQHRVPLASILELNQLELKSILRIKQRIKIPGNASRPNARRPKTSDGTYTVQRGDTVSEIALRFGTSMNELIELNGISNPDRLRVGTKLKLPGGNAPIKKQKQSPSKDDPNTYTVQRGDTISEIAQRFGTTMNALVELNSIRNPDRLRVGTKLKLPDGKTAPEKQTLKPPQNLKPKEAIPNPLKEDEDFTKDIPPIEIEE